MNNIYKIILSLISMSFLLPHGVDEMDAVQLQDGSLLFFIYKGAMHMATGPDHILFLIGVLFFLNKYSDIFKFITAFTIGHCITLIFATYYKIDYVDANLVDAIIAFSVIYKGFENLGGFKKWLSINAPNLLLMVFIFGLIHGFGLSTQLQDIANKNTIDLTLWRILSWNAGVEIGQIIILLIIFPLLSIIKIKEKLFKIISKISNWGLIFAGFVLLWLSLLSYFDPNEHHHEDKPNENHKNINTDEHKYLDKDNDKHHHNEKHEDNHDNGHYHDGHHHSH